MNIRSQSHVISDNLIQIFSSNPQIRLKNQSSKRSVFTIRRYGICQIISDVLSEIWRMDPRSQMSQQDAHQQFFFWTLSIMLWMAIFYVQLCFCSA